MGTALQQQEDPLLQAVREGEAADSSEWWLQARVTWGPPPVGPLAGNQQKLIQNFSPSTSTSPLPLPLPLLFPPFSCSREAPSSHPLALSPRTLHPPLSTLRPRSRRPLPSRHPAPRNSRASSPTSDSTQQPHHPPSPFPLPARVDLPLNTTPIARVCSESQHNNATLPTT